MAKPAPAARRLDDVVSSVRAFNRFYTRKMGVLEEGLRKTRFSLAEVQLLYRASNPIHTSQMVISSAILLLLGTDNPGL